MQKSWNAPELQLIHKFSNLQTLAVVIVPQDSPLQLVSCLQRVREHETALPDLVIDSLSVLKYEYYMLCHLENIEFCATYTSVRFRTSRSPVIIAIWPSLWYPNFQTA